MTLRKATRPAFALCIGFLLGCHSSSAQSPDAETRISVALRPGLSLEEARRLPDRAWVPVESGRLRFSQVHDLWVRLEIKPHTLENELFVSLGPPRADRIDAYALEDGRLYSVVTAGDRQPFRSPVPALALPRSPHEGVSVAYVRFRNATSNALNVSVVNAAQRQAILRGRSLALGLAGGAYASLAAFVATLFFLFFNRAFAYYFVFMGVAAYVVSSQNGLLHEYLFPDGGRPLNGMVRVMAAIGLASTMAFSRRFLEFPKLTIPVRLARALTLFVQWAGILLAPLFLFFESPLFFVLLGIVVPFAALVLVLMGFLAQRHHVYQSGAFSLGWTLVFAGTLWRFLDESGLVPSTPIGSQGLGVSFLLEAFVFTFALARRGRRILHETEHARDRLARIEGELGVIEAGHEDWSEVVVRYNDGRRKRLRPACTAKAYTDFAKPIVDNLVGVIRGAAAIVGHRFTTACQLVSLVFPRRLARRRLTRRSNDACSFQRGPPTRARRYAARTGSPASTSTL